MTLTTLCHSLLTACTTITPWLTALRCFITHWLNSTPITHWYWLTAWSVNWYSLRADSLKTPLATSVLLPRHVRRHPATSYNTCCRKRSPTVMQSVLLSDICLYSIMSHVHALTRRKRFHSTVASSCWGTTWPLPRQSTVYWHCPAMPSANPSQYCSNIFNYYSCITSNSLFIFQKFYILNINISQHINHLRYNIIHLHF
jgi:hypothetical protein